VDGTDKLGGSSKNVSKRNRASDIKNDSSNSKSGSAGMAIISFMLGLGVGVRVMAGLAAMEVYLTGEPFSSRDFLPLKPSTAGAKSSI
jgi:hypothetical protein